MRASGSLSGCGRSDWDRSPGASSSISIVRQHAALAQAGGVLAVREYIVGQARRRQRPTVPRSRSPARCRRAPRAAQRPERALNCPQRSATVPPHSGAVIGAAPFTRGEIARCCKATIATAATPAATADPASGRHQREAPRRAGRARAPCAGSPSMARFTRDAKPRVRICEPGAPQRLADQRISAEALAQFAVARQRFSSSSVSEPGNSPSRNAETCSRICSLMCPQADQGRHQKWVAAFCQSPRAL